MCFEHRWPPWPVGSVVPLIWRPSFSSGGFVAAHASAARSDVHCGSLAGSEGLPPLDRITGSASCHHP
ncbi:hypothetical protein SLEP1_g39300 [Rubroshorea leprosula]|uniref:Secreted protein n=1 Tax=Rubroshorea leprosula TaxID=152421 RepID=A0AAV5L0E4_9ROSI|nr:hypothetical protein SLEP1_g39300 [Rubroshorea leprosula]